MSEPEPTQRPWWKKKRYNIPLGLLVAFTLIGLFAPADEGTEPAADTGSDTSTDQGTDDTGDQGGEASQDAPAEDLPDAAAELACEHWRNVRSDIQAGILTPQEARAKIKEVYGDARVSDNPRIRRAGQRLLRAATTGQSMEEIVAAMDHMSTVCQDEVFAKLSDE